MRKGLSTRYSELNNPNTVIMNKRVTNKICVISVKIITECLTKQAGSRLIQLKYNKKSKKASNAVA